MKYKYYFNGLKDKLRNLSDTSEITKSIEDYTKEFFNQENKKVLFSNKNTKEFMYDISVLTFDPTNIIGRCGVLNDSFNEYRAFLLLESELGGTSASGPKCTFNNVMEDFSKLLIGNSKHKLMIMALSSYRNEENYIENRLNIIKEVYKKSDCNSEIGIIIIEGNHEDGESRQIKLDTEKMHLYILAKDKEY